MLPTRNKPDFKTLTARAPAKLIISGEYSVLYGQPALAMAVDRYITTTITCTNIPEINFNLLDLAYANSYTQQDLNYLAKKIHCDYNSFLSGNKNINSVLKQPCELLQYAVSNLLDILKITLPYGLNITVKSNIPMGCGMGSSAAAVISTITALADLLDCKWQRADCLNFSRKIENLQHAKSSGLDLHLVTYGGCVRFENGVANKLVIPQFPIKIVNTGTPQSNTGVCVANVASILQNNFDLANKFIFSIVSACLRPLETDAHLGHQVPSFALLPITFSGVASQIWD